MTLRWSASFAVAGFTAVALASFVALEVQDELQTQELLAQVTAPVAPAAPAAAPAAPVAVAKALPPSPKAGYYAEVRAKLQWVQTRMGGTMLLTPDMNSRMILAKSAARQAGLSEVGLSFKDVYGIIYAETSWVPRMGASKNGTPNLGIAQFEPATARALGLTNPEDPVEAIHVAAVHMKQAAKWSDDRLDGLKLSSAERAQKLREGVSIYYNLSTKGRNTWNGKNTEKLPRETQLHIANARNGAVEAALIDAQQRVTRVTGRAADTVASLASPQDGS
ncbi:lytic transglycosylase domain-containing protein [Caenimonas sp. SL110]|uniref:lytic transglycosylase domain-containing protein n=1 Tax=Caenimonas sp. SL110 TaxID=1450524 RepID=UPI00065403BC|nr:lytic transglycosylase domain-containing protein [Caenimonas sp. SL110]